jgi:hypothetical protein
MGCKYLSDSGGVFVPERAITEDNFHECPDWNQVGPRQKWTRDALFSLQGEGAVRVLHQLPRILVKDLVQTEQEEEEMNIDDNPNFSAMLREGLTTAEREEQLRFETDENGVVTVDEQGQTRPRPQYVISRFACDPQQHIQLDHSSGIFYKTDEVIKYILDREVEQGLLVKSKRPKKENQVADVSSYAEPNQKETQMPIEGRKIIRPTTVAATAPAEAQVQQDESAPPAPPPSGPKLGPVGLPRVGMAKVAQPPKRLNTGGTPPAATAGAASIELRDILPEFQIIVKQVIKAELVALKNEIIAELSAKVEEGANKGISAITILHDLACQTGGTFTTDGSALEQKFECEDKILDYIKQ